MWSVIDVLRDRVEVKAAIKLGITASISWTLIEVLNHFVSHPDSLVSGLWCTLTSIVVLQTHLGGTYEAALNRFGGIALGSIFGSLFTILFGSNPISLAVSIFLTVISCSLVNIKESIRIACMSVAIVMVLWGLQPAASPWTFAFYRMIDSTLGIIVAMAVAHGLWPARASRELRLNVSHILSRVKRLLEMSVRTDTMDVYSSEEYEQLIQDIEDSLHQDHIYLEEARLEFLTQPMRLELWSSAHEHLLKLIQAVLGLQRVANSTRKIIDSSLDEHVNKVVQEIDQSLQLMSYQLNLRQPVGPMTELAEALSELQVDLLRFRSTRATRQFALEDVEGLFVFFYNLSVTGNEIQNIAHQVNALYASTE